MAATTTAAAAVHLFDFPDELLLLILRYVTSSPRAFRHARYSCRTFLRLTSDTFLLSVDHSVLTDYIYRMRRLRLETPALLERGIIDAAGVRGELEGTRSIDPRALLMSPAAQFSKAFILCLQRRQNCSYLLNVLQPLLSNHMLLLDTTSCGVTDEDLVFLSEFTHSLVSLNLSRCEAVTDTGIHAILNGCLETHQQSQDALESRRCITNLGPMLVKPFRSKLTFVSVAGTGLRSLPPSLPPTLTYLDLQRTSVRDEDMPAVGKLSLLEHLDVSHTLIGPDGVQPHLFTLPLLTYVSFEGVDGLDFELLAKFVIVNTKVKTIMYTDRNMLVDLLQWAEGS